MVLISNTGKQGGSSTWNTLGRSSHAGQLHLVLGQNGRNCSGSGVASSTRPRYRPMGTERGTSRSETPRDQLEFVEWAANYKVGWAGLGRGGNWSCRARGSWRREESRKTAQERPGSWRARTNLFGAEAVSDGVESGRVKSSQVGRMGHARLAELGGACSIFSRPATAPHTCVDGNFFSQARPALDRTKRAPNGR